MEALPLCEMNFHKGEELFWGLLECSLSGLEKTNFTESLLSLNSVVNLYPYHLLMSSIFCNIVSVKP